MQLKEAILKLIELQKFDEEIHHLSLRKNETLPNQISQAEQEIRQLEEDFAAFKENVNRLELEKKSREGELSEREEKLKKTKAQLYQLKTNKEYQIKLNEIASIKADVSCSEESVIEILDLVEQEKGKITAQQEKVSQKVADLKAKIQNYQKEAKEIGEKINSLGNKRQQHTLGLEQKTLNYYQDLLKKRDGLAIVPVAGNNCGACHMALTHQKINEIKMYDKLVLCETCVRILYIPEDLELKG